MLARDRGSRGTFNNVERPRQVALDGVIDNTVPDLVQVVDHLHDVGLHVLVGMEDMAVVDRLHDEHHVEHPDHVDHQLQTMRLEWHQVYFPDALYLEEQNNGQEHSVDQLDQVSQTALLIYY